MDPISGQVASQMTAQASEISRGQESAGMGDSMKSESFHDVFSQVQAREIDAAPGVAEVSKSKGPASSQLRSFLDGVRSDEGSLDKMMSKSLSGAQMSPQDLLQMQALVYNYSQKVELASKVVSNAASGMKQIMNTQV